MGIKWISQRSHRVTFRLQSSCIAHNSANCFPYIPIVILLYITCGIISVVADVESWPPHTVPLTPSIGQKIKPDNTSLEHIYLRDITQSNSGKYTKCTYISLSIGKTDNKTL